jgi:hypothetical protein
MAGAQISAAHGVIPQLSPDVFVVPGAGRHQKGIGFEYVGILISIV